MKGLLRKGLPTQKNSNEKSHTDQIKHSFREEIMVIKYRKEAFYILVSPNEADREEREGMATRENTSGKFPIV